MFGKIRDIKIGFLYRALVKPVFFLCDPEFVHDVTLTLGRFLGRYQFTRTLTSMLFGYTDSTLKQSLVGIHFKNPIGLAAGFDKDGYLTEILPSVGFAFAEIGSMTAQAQAGNAKPRLWRLVKSKSIVVYYGLKNEGVQSILPRLQKAQKLFPYGISIAKENTSREDDGSDISSYTTAYADVVRSGVGDYITINISCPNVKTGESFTEPRKFDELFTALRTIHVDKPIFIKMASEMPNHVLDEIIILAEKHSVAGFISTNLAKSRVNDRIVDEQVPDRGGMSGLVVQKLSDEQIAYIYKKTKGKFVIIGCGGVFTAEDAYRKIRLGANLIQMITGMIFEGPQVVGQINRGLAELLKRDGYKNISEAVGVDITG